MDIHSSGCVFSEKVDDLTLREFSPESPLWIYAADKEFDDIESSDLQSAINQFTSSWLSHGQRVRPFGQLLFNRFVVLSSDANYTLPSGCSIDSSVHFIKQLETSRQVNFFNRLLVCWINKDNSIISSSYHDLPALIESGEFAGDTPIFDMTVRTSGEFINSWIKPASESWLSRTLF